MPWLIGGAIAALALGAGGYFFGEGVESAGQGLDEAASGATNLVNALTFSAAVGGAIYLIHASRK